MGDRHDGGAASHQLRQQFVVEFAAKFRVLVGRPLVQQQNRPLFQQRDDEREAFALAVGKIEGGKFAAGHVGLVDQAELPQQAVDLGRIGIGNPVEPVKEV